MIRKAHQVRFAAHYGLNSDVELRPKSAKRTLPSLPGHKVISMPSDTS
jgi:hypothetical protein